MMEANDILIDGHDGANGSWKSMDMIRSARHLCPSVSSVVRN